AGVNNYNVSVKIDGSDFVCGDIAVTLMAGDSAAENFERVFLNVLQNSNVITMSADSNGMVIGDASGKNAVILARQGLEGSNWTLVSYNLGSALETLTEGLNEPKLNIGLEGAVSGYTGINYITGIYKINNEKRAISFSQLVVTRMASPDEEASVLERNYLDLLEKVDAYQVSGNTLRLLNKDGMTLLTFIKD
ncbi:MAG: META domain-containing protein, partial [Spirochaetaceae bacterium]|nr:META domain-containing protein [Spirochaetaceae bacterium]